MLPNGVFWTTAIPDDSFTVGTHRAHLDLRNTPLCDSIFFGNCQGIASEVSSTVTWRAIGERVPRGLGTDVPPDTPGAFLAEFSDAYCEANVRGRQTGFNFWTNRRLDSSGFYANFGRERNGVFLA